MISSIVFRRCLVNATKSLNSYEKSFLFNKSLKLLICYSCHSSVNSYIVIDNNYRYYYQSIMNKLIDEINRNHLSFTNKLSELEERIIVAQTMLKQNKVNDKKLTDEQIETEKQRLVKENESLKLEVNQLMVTLNELEAKRKLNNDGVKPVSILNGDITKEHTIQINHQSKPDLLLSQNTDNLEEKTGTSKQSTKKISNKQKKDTKSNTSNEGNDDTKPMDGSRLDLRVGRILDAKRHSDADSLYVETIDCGEDKPRTVVSGLVRFIPIEQMQNRLVVVLCNLKPAKMRGITSEAMVMCASTPDKVEILDPPQDSVPGDIVCFDKYPGKPDSLLNPKKKIWEQLAPDLSTNSECVATYKGDPFVIPSKGVVKAQTLANVIVK